MSTCRNARISRLINRVYVVLGWVSVDGAGHYAGIVNFSVALPRRAVGKMRHARQSPARGGYRQNTPRYPVRTIAIGASTCRSCVMCRGETLRRGKFGLRRGRRCHSALWLRLVSSLLTLLRDCRVVDARTAARAGAFNLYKAEDTKTYGRMCCHPIRSIVLWYAKAKR